MKTKMEEIKADGIKLDRVEEISFKIQNNHGIRVDVIRADKINFKILNSHVVSPTADSQMNLKVVLDRDNARPKELFRFNLTNQRPSQESGPVMVGFRSYILNLLKIFKEHFKPPVRTIKMELPQHKQFNQLLIFISQLELLVKNLVITQVGYFTSQFITLIEMISVQFENADFMAGFTQRGGVFTVPYDGVYEFGVSLRLDVS